MSETSFPFHLVTAITGKNAVKSLSFFLMDIDLSRFCLYHHIGKNAVGPQLFFVDC